MGETVSSLLFQPPTPSKLKKHKVVWLTTARGHKVPGFYISYKRQGGDETCRSLAVDEIKDSRPETGITILYSHANAEDLGSIYPWCKFLSKMLQVNLFAYDYSGYGMAVDCGMFIIVFAACCYSSSCRRIGSCSFFGQEKATVYSGALSRLLTNEVFVQPVTTTTTPTTTGPPSEEDCIADIDAAYAYLRKTLNIPAQNIVLYGRSLGSGPSCQLAAKTALLSKEDAEYASEDGPVGGLILHAPFLSVYRVVIDTGCTLPGDKFPNVDIVPMVKTPVLLIHGTGDQIVSFSHSERLFKAIPPKYRARPLYIDGMGHNNVHSQVRPMFVDRLLEYLENHVWPMAVSQQPLPLSKTKKRGWKVEPEYEDEVATNRALSQPRIPS